MEDFVAGEALASQFELEFSLMACMVSSALGSVWYLDSRASFHVMGDKELFNSLEEKDLQMHIEMGDDRRYNAKPRPCEIMSKALCN